MILLGSMEWSEYQSCMAVNVMLIFTCVVRQTEPNQDP
jgi:hypothetical protein